MDLVVTLIAGPGGEPHVTGCAEMIAAALPGPSQPDWLAPNRACDFHLDDGHAGEAERIARAAIGNAPIDVVVQPAEQRRKRLLVADMESTIIENEMLEELAEFVGLRQHVAEITRRAMNGELDFVAALQERVALLKGLSAAVLDEAAGRMRLMPGARTLVATMRRTGAYTVLISGGFTVFAERIAAELGFDRVIANRLDIAQGHIAGTVSRPIVTRETKRDTLVATAQARRIPIEATLAIGDGANDLPMLLQAGLGIAFHAKPSVAAAAHWRLDHADLTGVLYAQGCRAHELVQG